MFSGVRAGPSLLQAARSAHQITGSQRNLSSSLPKNFFNLFCSSNEENNANGSQKIEKQVVKFSEINGKNAPVGSREFFRIVSGKAKEDLFRNHKWTAHRIETQKHQPPHQEGIQNMKELKATAMGRQILDLLCKQPISKCNGLYVLDGARVRLTLDHLPEGAAGMRERKTVLFTLVGPALSDGAVMVKFNVKSDSVAISDEKVPECKVLVLPGEEIVMTEEEMKSSLSFSCPVTGTPLTYEEARAR